MSEHNKAHEPHGLIDSVKGQGEIFGAVVRQRLVDRRGSELRPGSGQAEALADAESAV